MIYSFNPDRYFKDVADRLKDIAESSAGNHYTKAESLVKMEGFLAEMQYAQGYQLVLMDSFRAQIVDNKSDNILQKRFFTYFLLKCVPDGTFSGKHTAIADCKKVVDRITAKMLNDKRNYLNLMERLDVASITITQVGPIGSNWYGINVSFFMLDDPGYIVYDSDNWIPVPAPEPEPEPEDPPVPEPEDPPAPDPLPGGGGDLPPGGGL